MKRYALYLFVLGLFLSCKTDNNLIKYSITRYKEVDENYQYSKDMFWFKKKKYKPSITCEYNNDTLKSIVIYKSEGKIFYNRLEVKKDPLFMEMYGISEIKKAKIDNNIFYEDNKTYQITEQKKDSVFCMSNKNLLVIKLIQ